MRTATGTATRLRLVEAATRGFAEHGVERASLLDIARQADQRNRGAVHYHFGSRQGILVAVLEQYVDFLAERSSELIEVARAAPADAVTPVVEAIVRPAVELADTGWRGRCFLVVVAELSESDPASLHPEVSAVLARTGGHAVYDLLAERMPPLPRDLMVERLSLVTAFILHSVADRARAADRAGGRPQLDTERFTANLVAMATGMLAAAVPD